jgi:hypothetical protein
MGKEGVNVKYVLEYSYVWKNYIVQIWADLAQDSKCCIRPIAFSALFSFNSFKFDKAILRN